MTTSSIPFHTIDLTNSPSPIRTRPTQHPIDRQKQQNGGVSAYSFTDLLLYTQSNENVAKCTVKDVWEMRAMKQVGERGDPIFLLDQYPCRTVDLCAWISTVHTEQSYKDSEDSDMKLVLNVDDGEGHHALSVSQSLPSARFPLNVAPATESAAGPSRLTNARPPPRSRDSGYPRPTTHTKLHLFPAQMPKVGDVVMIRGKIREWRRKDGRVVREIKVGTGDGEGINVVSFHDESRHLIDVQAMHEAIYRHPFTMPVVPTSNLELPTKQVEHVKQRPISSECIRVTPAQQLARSTELPSLAVVEASQTESGCVASSLTSVMDRSRGVLRDPVKLPRKLLSMETFTRYLAEHVATALAAQTEEVVSGDIKSAEARCRISRYLPEIADNFADGEPSSGPSSAFPQHASSGLRPITIAQLQAAPRLKVLASRIVNHELRKQKGSGKGKGLPGNPREAALVQRSKREKVFREGVRRMVCMEGKREWVEVNLTVEDIEQEQAEGRLRNKLKVMRESDEDTTMESCATTTMTRSISGGTSTLTSWFNQSRPGNDTIIEEQGRLNYDVDECEIIDTTGYLPLTYSILGPVILTCLYAEADACAEVSRAGFAPRREGVTLEELTNRIRQLHLRWEMLEEGVVEGILEEMLTVEPSLIEVWGRGVWVSQER